MDAQRTEMDPQRTEMGPPKDMPAWTLFNVPGRLGFLSARLCPSVVAGRPILGATTGLLIQALFYRVDEPETTTTQQRLSAF